MKKIILITMILVVACNICIAQEKIKVENIDVDVSKNNNLDSILPRNAVYIFSDFTDGTVYFKNGTANKGKLNYNTLAGEMQFLDNGKILSLANNLKDIEYIVIGSTIFNHITGTNFAELLIDNKEIKLFIKRQTKLVDMQAKGAFGTTATTSTVTSIMPTQQYDISILRDLIFDITDEFLLEKNGKFTKITTAKTFIKAFPLYKDEINKYVESNKVNFKNEQDLIKLTNYCIQIITTKNE